MHLVYAPTPLARFATQYRTRRDLLANRYTTDPAPVIAELHQTAGDRLDILTKSVGTWVGSSRTPRPAPCAQHSTALRELAGLEP